MKTGRPRRKPLSMTELARNLVGTPPDNAGRYGVPPTMPPRPAWLKLGAKVVLPASDAVGSIFEIRPTSDGKTWEVACAISGRSANRRFRLSEIALWQEAPIERNTSIDPDSYAKGYR